MNRKVHRRIKRALDILGAVIGLVLTAPLFVILPLIIKLDSSGPVFYTQLRVGQNRRQRNRRDDRGNGTTASGRRLRQRRRDDTYGRIFNVIKFRTMKDDAEKESGPVWAVKDDPRVTRLGRILRKTRLDEIPQLINVLKGDMSLVGPRPERPEFVRQLMATVDGYEQRLSVKPGITGLAQVENGYDTSVDSVARKVRLDLEYIERWSLWLDFKILCKTFVVVLTGRGAC
ncbi:MAG: sugar transferase [Candidatus Zixiibacteriota bacterium]